MSDSYPVLPLREIVVFPSSVTPLYIMRPRSLHALDAALAVDKRLFLAAQKNPAEENPATKDLYEVGTVADVVQVLRLPDGSAKVLVEGSAVARIVECTEGPDHPRATVEELEFSVVPGQETEALRRGLVALFEQYAGLSEKLPEDLVLSIRNLGDPLQVANAVANYCNFRTADKQKALETTDVVAKLQFLTELLAKDNELLRIENSIISQVKSKIGKNQREYFLNEQLKVIEKELGIGNEEDVELDELQEKIRRSKMPEPAKEKAYRELNRLAKMAPLSPEATVSRTYIEWLTDLPWGRVTKDRLDLARAQQVLDEDHYGLEKVKERIVEHLAVHKLVRDMRGPILCFVGPPGVGKTSLARSIARALRRKFVRLSLGGMRDEAEIRGHRRTYIGSLPGKIVQWMKKAESMNPVFLLDEIDKMSSDFRGDPASALLEVLDPEQNRAFNDHYLEVDFDLSGVMFITTANTASGIPHPLLDRMEVIRLPGYTELEKRAIATNHIVPKQMRDHGLAKRQLTFDVAAIDAIVRSYTNEAGVRNLEREIAAVCRKAARQIVVEKRLAPVRVTAAKVAELLGPARYHDMELHEAQEIGVATGLAWTETGGEILPVEVTLMPGKGELVLTGKLGDVMKESARASLSYIRARCDRFKIDPEFHKKLDVHVHVPEGAIPKDGPSAGITMTIALLSALTNRPVRRDVAMTGEITLRGRVLKIGGLKEKAVAAHRRHIGTVIIPKDNEVEIDEMKPEIRDSIRFVPVRDVDEALKIAFMEAEPEPKPARKTGKPDPAKKRRPTRPRPAPPGMAKAAIVEENA